MGPIRDDTPRFEGNKNWSDEVADDGLYFPPEGVYFRLYHWETTWYLFARRHLKPELGSVSKNSESCQDQYFTFVKYKDGYCLKNKRTGEYLEIGATRKVSRPGADCEARSIGQTPAPGVSTEDGLGT